jgi:hypothetical protein
MSSSIIRPTNELSARSISDLKSSTEAAGIFRMSSLLGCDKSNISIRGALSGDFSLNTWRIPQQIGKDHALVNTTAQINRGIVIFGVTWIDGCVGPTSMKVNIGGSMVALFSLSCIYAPLVMASKMATCPKYIDFVCQLKAEKAFADEPYSEPRLSLGCSGYFSQPILVEPCYVLTISLSDYDNNVYGDDRQFILNGVVFEPAGMVIC